MSMNKSNYTRYWRIIWVSIGICLLFFLDENVYATDIDGHKIEVASWGPAISGIQLGYGFDVSEMNDPNSKTVTFEFQVKNNSSSEAAVAETIEHRGIHFFVNNNGVESELLDSQHHYGLQNNFGFVHPNGKLHIYLRLTKEELHQLASSAAVARITIHEPQNNSVSAVAPFNIEVPFKVSE